MEQRLANLKWRMDNRARWLGTIDPSGLILLITCLAPVCLLWQWFNRR